MVAPSLFLLTILAFSVFAVRDNEFHSFHRSIDSDSLYSQSLGGGEDAFAGLGREVTRTPCSVVVAPRTVTDVEQAHDRLFELPLDFSMDAKVDMYSARLNVHARFQSSAEDLSLPSDLFIALTDGEVVIGYNRLSPRPQSDRWGFAQYAKYNPTTLASGHVVSAEGMSGRCSGPCAGAHLESFQVDFIMHAAHTVVVARPMAQFHESTYASAPVTFPVAFENNKPLSLVLYAGAGDNAYEISSIELTISEGDASAAEPVFTELWPAYAMLSPYSDVVLSTAVGHSLEAGCGLAFDQPRPIAGVAFNSFLTFPLRRQTINADRSYLFRVHIDSAPTSPHNLLVVALSDGEHAVGLVRGDATSQHFGKGFASRVQQYGDEFIVADDEYVEVLAGGAGVPRRFYVDIVVGSGVARVLGFAEGMVSAEALLDASTYGLDLSKPLYLVLMQGSQDPESSVLYSLSLTVQEVQVGCDGVSGSTLVVDQCGVCGGSDACVGCDGVVNSGMGKDACGVCGGRGDSCRDCRGVMWGTSKLDSCGICDGTNACVKSLATERTAAALVEEDQTLHMEAARSMHVDCEGTPVAMGGDKMLDMCGVCGGNNECFGCDGVANSGVVVDVCGVCGGDNTTCCHNYLGIADAYWNYLLLPVTIDDLIEKFDYTNDMLFWMDDILPSYTEVKSSGIPLPIGNMAEFNRIFLEECLCEFCEKSGNFYVTLLRSNFDSHVVHSVVDDDDELINSHQYIAGLHDDDDDDDDDNRQNMWVHERPGYEHELVFPGDSS